MNFEVFLTNAFAEYEFRFRTHQPYPLEKVVVPLAEVGFFCSTKYCFQLWICFAKNITMSFKPVL